MRYNRLPFKEFQEIYLKVPRATVDIIVVAKDGFILTKRSIPPYKGFWHLPGGTILFKEKIESTVKRVAQEELGVKVKIIRKLGIIQFLNDGGRHTVSIAILARIRSGKLSGSEQAEIFKYFKKLPKNIIPEQGKFISKLTKEIEKYWQ